MSEDNPLPPPVTEQTLDILKDLRKAVEEEDNARILKDIAPALLFEDRLSIERDEIILTAICDLYIKAMLLQEEYEPVVNILTQSMMMNNTTKQRQQRNKRGEKILPLSIAKQLETARIYAMYRLERYEGVIDAVTKALERLNKTRANESNDNCEEMFGNDRLVLRHMQGQAYYNMNDYQSAEKVYEKLLMEHDNFDEDRGKKLETIQLLNNLVAIPTAHMLPFTGTAGDEGNVIKKHRSKIEAALKDGEDIDYPSTDLAYNLATHELCTAGCERGTFDANISMLSEAIQMTQTRGGVDGLSTEEIAKEVAPMKWNVEWSRLFWQGSFHMMNAKVDDKNNNKTRSKSQQSSAVTKHASMATRMVALANEALKNADVVVSTNKSFQQTSSDAIRLLPKPNNKLFTPFQNNLLYYNRAILQYRSNQIEDCQKTCDEWVGCVYNKMNVNVANGNANNSSSNNNNNKSKTKLCFSTLEVAWWNCRIAVLRALCLNKSNSEQSTSTAVKLLREQLDVVRNLSSSSSSSSSSVRDEMILYLEMHKAKIEKPDMTTEDIVNVLQSLPESIQKEKAVIATMASLYHKMGKESEAHAILKASGHEEALADFLLNQGRFQEVVNVLENRFDNISRATYVKALSYVDPEKTIQIWDKMKCQLNFHDDEENDVDGAQLELRELPRLKSSSQRKEQADMVATSASNNQWGNKKSHEAIMRRRARKREAYLAELEQKGRTNLATHQPDPERWLPKYERSYNRRRRNRQQHRGAQGGVSEREAAKLDVAARQAARASGTVTKDAQSTAHLAAVSSGGPRKGGRRKN